MSAPAPPTGSNRGHGPLRRRVARGVFINAAFLALVNGIGFLRGGLVVVMLTAAEYGIWGIVASTLALLVALRQNGVSDRYVQQDDEDQERAYQVALTLDLLYSGALLVLGLVLFPIVAVVYGQSELLLPGLALTLVLPGMALQTPLAIFYRRLDFARQRKLQAIDPLVGFAVTIPLVALGAGVWGIVAGAIAGPWAAAAAALLICPFRNRLRWEPGAARAYVRFTWPMILAAVSAVVIAQVYLFTGQHAVGLAGAGFIALSLVISQYANRFDQIVGGSLYPAMCAARHRMEVLLEVFEKSSRLAIMWGFPLGIGLTLFAEALVEHALAPDWREGVIVLQATGIVLAVHRVGYMWDSVFRALGRTEVIVTNTVVVLTGFGLVCIPLALTAGLRGVALSLLALELVSLVSRAAMLSKVFSVAKIARRCVRPMLPALMAAAAVVVVRAASGSGDDLGPAVAQAALFVAVVCLATARLEREIIGEVRGYLRNRRAPSLTEPLLSG